MLPPAGWGIVMELTVRPAVSAGVALAAAGMIAVTPVIPALPDLQVPDIQLTGLSEDLQGLMIDLNTGLIDGLTGFNEGLLGGQIAVEQLLFGSDSALNGVINRLFNTFNMGLDVGQNALNGLLGVNVAGADSLTESLLVGLNPAGIFRAGDIGGLEGMFGNGLQAFANITGFPDLGMMTGLESAFLDFNKGLVDGFLDFNQFLVGAQVGLEQLIFG
ncbi:MAG TPA: hypothetical protein VL179_08100, partial [Mycobacterium sp.]|nr:hypothetical protein [Mycobacterium sp.]